MKRLALGAAGGISIVAIAFQGGCSANDGNGSTLQGQGGSSSGASSSGGSAASSTGGGIIIGSGGNGATGPIAGVPQTCGEAIERRSYIGCEYWPTVTSNAGLYDGFEFAIAAANPTDSPAEVTVQRGGAILSTVTVAPGGLQTIRLPWVQELKQESATQTSGLVRGGAFRVNASVPITLYQFNPLEFELPSAPADCGNPCNSFSNDASLLLPTTALGTDYYAMSYPTHHIGATSFGTTNWIDAPGFVSVTGTADGTNVTVNSSGFVRAGGGVSAMTPGGTQTYQLNAGDVLVLASGVMPNQETPQPGKPCGTQQNGATTVTMCPSPQEYDLTGTHITSDQPVSVIGGHDCTFVPFSRFACDHLEESIFPTETLGQDLLVTAPQAVAGINSNPGQPDNMFVRVMSAADGNNITFDPPVNAPVALNAGQWIEIGPIDQDFRVQADDRVAVAQFMVGENFSGQSVGAGDPAQSIAIPVEQYRVDYTFLAPTTYTYNFVNVTAPSGASISIDGTPIDPGTFSPIGSSGFGVARVQIAGGAHEMTGDRNFGIVAYGYGSFTSYMYPGGLNLETVVIIPK